MPQPRKHFLPEHYGEVHRLAARGCSERTIAKAVGLSYGSWRRALEADARAKGALEEGRAEEHDALVGSLFRAATDPAKPNVIAAIFLLKCRHQYCDTPPPPQNTNVEIVVQVPGPLTPEQYRQVLDITPGKVLEESGVVRDR